LVQVGAALLRRQRRPGREGGRGRISRCARILARRGGAARRDLAGVRVGLLMVRARAGVAPFTPDEQLLVLYVDRSHVVLSSVLTNPGRQRNTRGPKSLVYPARVAKLNNLAYRRWREVEIAASRGDRRLRRLRGAGLRGDDHGRDDRRRL